MSKLRVSAELSLPLAAATQTFAILAMRGAGKSNAAVVLAEEMYDAGLHWVAIDPKGDWWGIRSSADGKSGGLPIPIFGGQHGDVPIEPSAGAYLAELIVAQGLTCVLDLSEFTEGEKIRFMAGSGREDGFAARFYRRKGPEQPPTHLFFEEADDLFPQRVMRDKAKLLHDCSKLLLWGRQRGISGSTITQRSARLHKDVLTQTDTLIAMRTTAPQDRKAVLAWVEHQGLAKTLVDSLPSLGDGDAWLWSPSRLGLMERIHFRRRRTFDSGAAPVIGKHRDRKPATLADVDLAAITAQMAETIERAKAEDPRELRRRIAELERERSAAAADPAAIDAAFERGRKGAVQEFRTELDKAVNTLLLAEGELQATTERLFGLRTRLAMKTGIGDARPGAEEDTTTTTTAPVRRPETPRPAGSGGRKDNRVLPAGEGLSTMERRLLTALAQHPEGLTKGQVRLHADYADSGPVSRAFARLNVQGWVEAEGTKLRITGEGRRALGGFDPLPVGLRLQGYLLGPDSKLSGMERALLGAVTGAYPEAIGKGEARKRAGYADSGPVSRAFARLLKYGYVVSDGPSRLRASERLFGGA